MMNPDFFESQEDMQTMQIESLMHRFGDMPDSNAVMAAICCATTQYAIRPSLQLALLIEELAYTLNSPDFANTPLMRCVAERLMQQWGDIVDAQESQLLQDETRMPYCH